MMWRINMNVTGHAQGHVHTWAPDAHQHGWYDGNTTTVLPSAGWIGGTTGNWVMRNNNHYFDRNVEVAIDAERIMFQNKNLTKGLEDMALLLKMIVEKYDLHEVKELMESSEIAVWAKDGEYRVKDICEEKKEHLDEKLFEI